MRPIHRIIAVLALVLAGAAPASAATYAIDPAHSSVNFKIKHLMVSWVHGKFNTFSGTFDYDPKNLRVWKTSVTIDAASIDTGIEMRDKHLRSADFFDTAKYPALSFVMATVTEGKAGAYALTGNLTMHGVTKPVVLDLESGGTAKDPKGRTHVGFSASAKLNRKDFGVAWNQDLKEGGVMIGEDVFITIEIDGILQP